MALFVVIDDDPTINRLICEALDREDHEFHTAQMLGQGFDVARQVLPDIVFLDLSLPDGNGLEWLEAFLEIPSNPEVIVITAGGSEQSIETAIYRGAWDFVQKPFSIRSMTHLVRQALRYRKDKSGKEKVVALNRQGLIGGSPTLHRCLQQAAQASTSGAPCLIRGETGVGKELIARIIHANSPRSGGPFVVVDCAALSESLVDSILFGHRKGAFTGAHADKVGLIQSADKGILFLDEIGELPMDVQKNLLRVLQEQTFRPVGALEEKRSNFRLISATHRNLAAMVEKNAFRQDLLYRIMGQEIFVPPLRDRLEDLDHLTAFFLQNICQQYNLPVKGISSDFLPTLRSYDWPGNIRELRHCLEHSVVSADPEPILYPQQLPNYLRVKIAAGELEHQRRPVSTCSEDKVISENQTPCAFGKPAGTLKEARAEGSRAAEKIYLKQLIFSSKEKTVKDLCEKAGVSVSHFYALLRKHELELPHGRST
ncbi:two-component system NtrC family response regulator [Desulfosalsimonas propionicica]|uniref:Two-component system NtrC family response regulator n=1 Tax=Desulfosalsimonas propionicica TaxID=332175 RepID=A0A7W0HKU6_9BACT|nr:sigma-54 dependent transcriptional regulator [Desulfosalsimonas propionicica]MBA2881451.1 two-component system NtrC family response regulator [Desulfosalsimonas propionicica]